MPDILNPLPDIASHVVKAECVWLERIDGRRLFAIPFAAAAIAIGVALPDLITPIIAGRGAGPRGIFPFGLCQKPVLLAGQPGEPAHILLGILPGHIDRGHLLAPPGLAGFWASRRGDASVPLVKCHSKFAYGEWCFNRNRVPRAFLVRSALLI